MQHRSVARIPVGTPWRVLLRDLGLDEQAVLRRAGLPATLLEGSGGHVSVDQYDAFYRALEEEANDPTVALRVGQVFASELFYPALFAATCSPDMNSAARRLGEHDAEGRPFMLDVDVGPSATQLHYLCGDLRDAPPVLGVVGLVFLVAFARRATRHRIVPQRLTFKQRPRDPGPYVAYFGCPVEVHASYTVTLGAEDASRPFLTRSEGVLATMEPALRRTASVIRGPTTREQVEASLVALLPKGRARMKDVADAMGIGVRTLQRRLAVEATTWLEVLNQTRKRLALHYLQSTSMSPMEISFLLGFADPNSLFRAFHRWTGTTPEAWREAQR